MQPRTCCSEALVGSERGLGLGARERGKEGDRDREAQRFFSRLWAAVRVGSSPAYSAV